MAIQFAVHTYGHFDAMFYILNGIKMIMNSDFANSLIKFMALITTSYYSLRGITSAAQGGVGYYFLKTAGMLLLISALLTPKADMLVIDRITKKKEVVSDLPYAFVLPVGMLEAIGAGITSLFEQAFAPVSSMAYKDYGLIFGQRLVQESRNWRINNPEFAKNMNVFLERCVVLESMIGSRFTVDDLFTTNDIFGLAIEKAGKFRQVDITVRKKNQRVNCHEAGKVLKDYLKPEIDFLNFKLKNSDFSLAGSNGNVSDPQSRNSSEINSNIQINQLLNKNLEIGYASSLGVRASASEIIRQNMMINTLKDWGNISDKYGYTRADDLQKSNWKISGELAKEYLPLLLNIMKGLIYASFIFIVPLMILSGGITHYLKYCAVVFSLQIWPALNAILNLFIELYSNSRVSTLTNGEITFANFNQVYEAIDAIVLVASGLQMSIPFLSFAIVQGGVGSFVHLASTMQGASTAAAGTASSELTSGNRSFDNISRDTASIGNKSGFKTDFNQSYQEGATQVQSASGAMLRTFADGSSSISSGSGINKSSGSRSMFMEDAKQVHLQEGLSNSLNLLKGDEKHYQESQSSAVSTATDRIAHLAQKQAAGKSLNIDSTTEEGRAMQQAINKTVSLYDGDEYNWNQAASASVKAYADAGITTPNALPFVKASAGIGVDGSVSANNTSSQSLAKNNLINREDNANKSLNTLLRAASNEHYTKEDSVDQSLAQSTKANYDKMQSYGQSISQRKEEAESYSSALQVSQSKGATDRRDMYHDLEENVAKQYGVSKEAAHQMIESNDPRANKTWNSMIQSESAKEIAEIKAGKSQIIEKSVKDGAAFQNDYAGKINDQGQKDLQNQAAKDGLDINLMNNNIQKTSNSLNDRIGKMNVNANDQINSTEQNNLAIEKGMQTQVDKLEEDRIGQGITSKVVGAIAKIPTLGHSGDFNVGGKNSTEKADGYLKGQDKAQQSSLPVTKKNR